MHHIPRILHLRAAARAILAALPAGVALAALPAGVGAQVPDTARTAAARQSAQTSAGEAARDTAPPISLPPIVVRTDDGAAAAPYAVSVLGPQRVAAARADRGLAGVLHGVPGLQADNRYNEALGDRLSIRGFGARSAFGVRGVRVYIDGIPATLPDGQTDLSRLDLAAVREVEVLRGPASAIYGNAAGGVVMIHTTDPGDAPLAVQAGLLAGSGGLARAHTRVGGRSAGFAYQARLTRRHVDGFRAFAASSRTVADFRGSGSLAGGRLDALGALVDYAADNPGSLTANQLRADPTQANPANVAQKTSEAGRQGLVGLRWDRRTGAGRVELTGWGLLKTLDNPIPPVIIDLHRRAAGGRVLWLGGIGPVGVAVGGEAGLQRDDRRNHENDGGARGDLVLSQVEWVRQLGAFTHTRLPIGNDVDFTAGARYDSYRFRARDRFTDGDPNDSGERVMSAFSPTAGVRARLAGALDLYANVATAFETPTTTELVNRPDSAGGFNPDLEPQRTTSVELGARGDAGRLTYQVAVYRARVRDALIPFEVATSPGRQYYRNAGTTRHQGVETAVSVSVTPRLRADMAYTWTDARFRDFEVDARQYGGNRVPGVTPHRFEGTLTGRLDRALIALDATVSGRTPVDDANTDAADGYTLLSVRGEWTVDAPGLRVDPFAGISNILDTDYISSVAVNAFGRRFFEPGPGRAFHLGVRATFNGRR